jgi:hypothetical protein
VFQTCNITWRFDVSKVQVAARMVRVSVRVGYAHNMVWGRYRKEVIR